MYWCLAYNIDPEHKRPLSFMITTTGVRIWHEVHCLISFVLMMIRHILLYPHKFKYHPIVLIYRQKLWALNALQGLSVLSSKHRVLVLNHDHLVASVLCLPKHYNFSKTDLDNHWRNVYTNCMDALSTPEMQNVLGAKFPKIASSSSKLDPFTCIAFLSISLLYMIGQKP